MCTFVYMKKMSTPNTIQAGDLRVGNLLKCNDIFIEVSGIGKTTFTCTHKRLIYFCAEDCEPIELTPTILEECGFIEDETGFAYHLGKLSINLPNFNAYINGRTYFNSWCIIEGVPSYLHQLQNLIYSLTGKELNYQPIK